MNLWQWRLILIAVGLPVLNPGLVNAIISADEALLEALRLKAGGYHKEVRPAPDSGDANLVGVSFNLNRLVGVDSTSQEVTLQLWFTLQWQDPRLAWLEKFNASLDQVDIIFLPISFVWRPDVGFINLLNVHRMSPSEKLAVVVTSNGVVQHSEEIMTLSKCDMDLTMFPYDTQTCGLTVGSNAHTADTVHLSADMNKTVSTYLMKNNDFCIVAIWAEHRLIFGYEGVQLLMQIKRRPTFYLVNLILPSLLLLAISTITFRLPPECGERISFSVTIVLSMCVFLQLAGNYTPTQSKSVPLLTYYCSLAVVMTMLCVLGNVFVLNCHHRQQNGHRNARVNYRLVRLLFLNRLVTGRFSLFRKQPVGPSEVVDGGAQLGTSKPPNIEAIPESPSTNQSAKAQTDNTESGLGQQSDSVSQHPTADPDRHRGSSNEWSQVVAAADRLLFALHSGVAVAVLVALAIFQTIASQESCISSVSG